VLDKAFITHKSEARVEEKQEPQTDEARLQVFAKAERWLLSWSVAAAGAALLALILQTLAG
jgi:hypothetical protein